MFQSVSSIRGPDRRLSIMLTGPTMPDKMAFADLPAKSRKTVNAIIAVLRDGFNYFSPNKWASSPDTDVYAARCGVLTEMHDQDWFLNGIRHWIYEAELELQPQQLGKLHDSFTCDLVCFVEMLYKTSKCMQISVDSARGLYHLRWKPANITTAPTDIVGSLCKAGLVS